MSIYHVTGSTGQGILADRTLFVGPKIPDEIKAIKKHIKKIDKTTFRNILQVLVASLEGKDVTYEHFKALESNELNEETLGIIYSGLLKLLHGALRIPQASLKQEVFREDLKDLSIPEDFIGDITSVVFGAKRPVIDVNIKDSHPKLPKLESFSWRTDVAISTSVLNRVLEPSIIMQMTLSDGKVHNFEVPVSKFHELRYNVASLLREMEDLEKRSILKIQDKS